MQYVRICVYTYIHLNTCDTSCIQKPNGFRKNENTAQGGVDGMWKEARMHAVLCIYEQGVNCSNK